MNVFGSKNIILRKVISIFAILLFSINTISTAKPAIGALHRDNLAAASILDDLGGIEHKDIGNIMLALQANLLSSNRDVLDVESLKEDLLLAENTIYNPANMNFIFSGEGMKPLPNGQISVKCKVANENRQLRTYYVVFSTKKDGKGFPMEVYTEKEWQKYGTLSKNLSGSVSLPKRALQKPKDMAAILRYMKQEAYDRNVIQWAHENGLTTEIDIQEDIDAILEKANISIEGIEDIKRRKCYLIPADVINVYTRMVRYPVTFVDSQDKVHKIIAYAHSSNNAIHIFLPGHIINQLNSGKQGEDTASAHQPLRRRLAHELGVMVGLPVQRSEPESIPDKQVSFMSPQAMHFPINEIDIRYGATEELENKSFTVVDLDKNLIKRDYAASKIKNHFIGMSMGATSLYAAIYRNKNGKIEIVGTPVVVDWDKVFNLKKIDGLMEISQDIVFEEVIKVIEELLRLNCFSAKDLNNIGCSAPGIIDDKEGVIKLASNMPFREFPFAKKMRERTGIGVTLSHDGRAALEGEISFGGLKGVNNGYVVIQGTGLGGSLAVNGSYYPNIPEFTEPGRHIVGTPVPGKTYGYRYRFIKKYSKDRPFEVVDRPAKNKKYQITEIRARELIREEQFDEGDFIWIIRGEKAFTNIVSGKGIELMLIDKEKLCRQFGKRETFDNINVPEDITIIALSGEDKEKQIAMDMIKYIGEEMGKGLAVLIKALQKEGVPPERIVIGSTVGENLGKGIFTKDGKDYYLDVIQRSVRAELIRLGMSETSVNTISREVIRSPI
ncbi:MAG: ROK family protein, partial [Candidatus Omnitrophica bacterium]|nr:ROK family protein [Candidatus Omnitrophota bacterium]